MFRQILNSIERNFLKNKKVSVFFICLLLASFFWLLNALNKTYTELVEVPIRVVDVPKDMVMVGLPPESMQFRVKGTGFNLIGIDNSWQQDSVPISANGISTHKVGNGFQGIISTAKIQREAASDFGSGIEILEVSTDTFRINLEPAKREELKVKLRSNLNPKDQYKIKKVELFPAYVEVSGPFSEVDNVSRVKTDSLILSNFDKKQEGEVTLSSPCYKCVVTPNKVVYEIDVEPITEAIISVPIEFINVPSNVVVSAHPKQVEVVCLVGLSEYNQLKSDMFDLVIDYRKIEQHHPSKAVVEVLNKPDFAEISSFTPQRVEYIYRTK